MNEIVINTSKDSYEEDEVFCCRYICPSCKCKALIFDDNYCSNCGIKLKWEGKDLCN